MAINQTVNPPPIPRIPRELIRDKETRDYFQQIQRILFQLWIKTGAGGSLLNDTLTSISELGTAADKGIYTTDINTFAEFDITSFARSILDDTNEAAFKATVNLEIGIDVQAYDATLQSISALGTVADRIAYTTNADTWAETPLTAFARSILDDVDEATFKATVNLEIGADVQGYSVNLDEASTFFASTDISAAEAETLTDTSNADSLHVHSTSGLSDVLSGTYTPTLANIANLDSSTAYACQYMRVGNVVTVSGKVDADPTAGSATVQLGISLPIASTLSNDYECCGTAAEVDGNAGSIYGDTTDDRAQLEFVSVGTSNETLFFTFTYQVI